MIDRGPEAELTVSVCVLQGNPRILDKISDGFCCFRCEAEQKTSYCGLASGSHELRCHDVNFAAAQRRLHMIELRKPTWNNHV